MHSTFWSLLRGAVFSRLILLLLVAIIGCGDEKESSALERVAAGSAYGGVAFINAYSSICSGVFLKHGLVATAAHCFVLAGMTEEQAANGLTLHFSFSGRVDGTDDLVLNATSVAFDGPNTDLAYIQYDAAQTASRGELTAPEIHRETVKAGATLALAGYPIPGGGMYPPPLSSGWDRIETRNCTATGEVGRVAGYNGDLHGTDCIAWFGNSGGPVYLIAEQGVRRILGLVSHTFAPGATATTVTPTGSDQFGEYVPANFTPFARSDLLDSLIQ